MTQSAILAASATSGVSQSLKNRIINGAMVIDQRNAGASIAVADSNVYPIDRFLFRNATDGTATAQQSSTVPTGGGFVNSVIWTVGTADASLAAGQYSRIAQVIEGYNFADLQWGTASAKTITISFWVRSSVTGTYSVTLYNSAADRGYAATYTISAANTWEQKTVTIAGDTTGTWLTNNGKGVTVNFGLGAGTDYSISAGSWTATSNIPLAVTGQTNLMATAGATFYITGVQLEVGTTATNFEYRQYGTELQLCQRYYFRRNSSSSQDIIANMQAYSTTAVFGKLFDFPVQMRTTPTSSYSNIGHLSGWNSSGGSAQAFTTNTGITADTNGIYAISGLVTGSSFFTLGACAAVQFNTTSGWIDASAEL